MSVINIRNLYKTYRGSVTPSVNNLSLEVSNNEFFGLLGPNGAGKTTTMSVLCGLLKADSGSVTVCGYNILTEIKSIKPLIGVVPQDIALYPELTVAENLHFFGQLYGLSRKKIIAESDRYIKIFGLTEHIYKQISQLSGGMKRQVNLIVALLHRPSLLVLDEPTTGVDVHSRQKIVQILQSLYQCGMTILYTSHDMKEAETLCTRVALLNKGEIIIEGKSKELIKRERVNSLEELFIKKTEQ